MCRNEVLESLSPSTVPSGKKLSKATLKIMTDAPIKLSMIRTAPGTALNSRKVSLKAHTTIDVSTPFQALIASTSYNEIKPRLLESGLAQNKTFLKLSGGFKNVFSSDLKDRKMVIPICGYSGHRRGESAQNFFGKSFRDVSI